MGLAIAAARPRQAEPSRPAPRAALAGRPAVRIGTEVPWRTTHARSARTRNLLPLVARTRLRRARSTRLEGFDWYTAGATRSSVARSRTGAGPSSAGALPNTCLALLFLRKANLAFELDRVLKLPGARRPEVPAPAEPRRRAAVSRRASGVEVVVTGASDAKFPEIAVEFEVNGPTARSCSTRPRQDFHVTEDDRRCRSSVPGADRHRAHADHGRPGPRPQPEHGGGGPDRQPEAGGRDFVKGLPGRLAGGRGGVRLGGREGLPVHRRLRAGPARRRRA